MGSRLGLAVLGIVIFLMCSGFAAFILWNGWNHSHNWQPVSVAVTATETRCQVEVKKPRDSSTNSSARWQDEGSPRACDEARRHLEEKRGLFSQSRRIREIPYVTLAYDAGGSPRSQTVARSLVTMDPVAVGDRFETYVDPRDAMRLGRGLSTSDYVFSGGLFLLGLVFLVLLWMFPHIWTTRRRSGVRITAG